MVSEFYSYTPCTRPIIPICRKNTVETCTKGGIPLYHLKKLARGISTSMPCEPLVIQCYNLSLLILSLYFGPNWVERYVVNKKRRHFFDRPISRKMDSSAAYYRIRDLAEHVMNLSYQAGIEAPLRELLQGKIESGFAELQAGKVLRTYNIPFEYRIKSNVKGQDYDLDLKTRSGKLVHAEVKCKVEGPDLSLSSLVGSLDTARKGNLPKNGPSMVFVKVPQEWLIRDENRELMAEECQGFLGKTSRIVSVIVYSAPVEAARGGDALQSTLQVQQIIRRQSIHGTQEDFLLKTPGVNTTPPPRRWRRLKDLFPLETRLLEKQRLETLDG